MLAIITLVLLFYVSLLSTRIAAIILVYTGISQKIAHFQARSALSGTGFTTRESELIMAHPLRRKVVLVLMLFGNIGVVAMFATFLLSFLREGGAQDWVKLAILGAGLIGLWLLANSKTFEKWLDNFLSRILRRRAGGTDFDIEHLCHLGGGYKVTSVSLLDGSPAIGKTLHTAFDGFTKIKVLGIEKPTGEYLGVPSHNKILEKNDSLVIYGLNDNIEKVSRKFSPPSPENKKPS